MAPLRAAGPSANDLVASRGDFCPPTRKNPRFPELIGPLVVMAPAVLHAIFMNQSFACLGIAAGIVKQGGAPLARSQNEQAGRKSGKRGEFGSWAAAASAERPVFP